MKNFVKLIDKLYFIKKKMKRLSMILIKLEYSSSFYFNILLIILYLIKERLLRTEERYQELENEYKILRPSLLTTENNHNRYKRK